MDDENENGYIEDAWDQLISDAIDYINAKSDMVPGSEEYKKAVYAVRELFEAKIRYTEVQMKYDDAEAQREHELKLKRMEYDLRMKELEAEKLRDEAQSRNAYVTLAAEVGKEVLKGVLTNIIPAQIFNGLAHEVIVSEYQNNRFINSTSWKMASSAINKSLKS